MKRITKLQIFINFIFLCIHMQWWTKAPHRAEPWEGVRDATIDGSACYNKDLMQQTSGGSEDCLYLNIFTKSVTPDKLKPVMLFIHGGAFLNGSNDSNMFNPDYLLTEDVVLVAINYRLGILGFLCLHDPTLEVPGNAALKDQVLALEWVQKNISNFGGDPNNITVFGESAGSASVHYLMLSPTTKNLFHKVILQSGCVMNPWAHGRRGILEELRAIGKTLEDEKEALEYLKKLPVDELIMLQEDILNQESTYIRVFAPVVEKPNPTAFIIQDPYELLKTGQYNKVPLMLGWCDREGLLFEMEMLKKLIGTQNSEKADVQELLFTSFGLSKDSDQLKDFEQKIRKLYFINDEILGRVLFQNTLLKNLEDDPQYFQPAIEALMNNYQTNAKKSLQLLSLLHTSFKNTEYKPNYPPTTRRGKQISVQPTAIARRHSKYSGMASKYQKDIELLTDLYFLSGIMHTADLHIATSSTPVYLYRFSAETALNGFKYLLKTHISGACHADELAYLFKNPPNQVLEKGCIEDISIHRMVKLWTDFAKYSNPTPPGTDLGILWQQLEKDSINFLDIGNKLAVSYNPEPDRVALWSDFEKEFYRNGHRLSL